MRNIKFGDLKQGDIFWPANDKDDEIYMKVDGEMLSNIVNEGEGGHAILLSEGLLCFFYDHELVDSDKLFGI